MNRYGPESQPYSTDRIIPERVTQLTVLDQIFDNILVKKGGWDKFLVYTQPRGLNVYAYRNTDGNLDNIELGTLHGTEQIGVLALAESAPTITDLNRGTLIIPILNKLGFSCQERYSSNGESVGDMSELFGYRWTSPTPESAKLIEFLLQQKYKKPDKAGTIKRTSILDIHEDNWWEDGDKTYIDSGYSYLYVAGKDSDNQPLVNRITQTLHQNGNHLPKLAHTRFPGEVVVDGVVRNSEDGSIEHLLAFLGANTITTEITRRTPHNPTIHYRINLQHLIINAFLGIEVGYHPNSIGDYEMFC